MTDSQLNENIYRNDMYDENKRQEKIKQAKESFQEATVLYKSIIKCRAVKGTFHGGSSYTNKFQIGNNRFRGRITFKMDDDKINNNFYASVCIVEFGGIKYRLCIKVYNSKQKALKHLKNITDTIYIKLKSSTHIRIRKYHNKNVMGQKNKSIRSQYCSIINIPIKDIKGNEVYRTDDEYKSVSVNIKLYKEGLKITSNYLDTIWFFNRKKTGKLPDEAIKMIKNPQLDDEYRLTVKSDGPINSDLISECGDWWIVKESI